MRRLGFIIKAALGVACGLALAGPAAAQFRPDPWLSDLDQARDALSARYANLEWQVERGLDLPEVYGQARRRIEAAPDETAARRAMERFLQRFADGHLDVRWPSTPRPTTAPQAGLCGRLAYASPDTGAIAASLPGYAPLAKGDPRLPAGLLSVDGRRVGVLRISAFDALAIGGFCEEAVALARLTPETPCDEACEGALRRSAKMLFKAAVAAQIKALAAAKAEVLLIDVAGNGGGDDSALTFARMLTGKPLKGPRVGLLRTREWDAELAEQQADIRAGLANAKGQARAELDLLDRALSAARAQTTHPCDRRPLWEGKPLSCTLVITTPLHATGLVAGDAPWAGGAPWGELVSKWVVDPYARPIWAGPLIILADQNSASSTELFAAMLQDAQAAVVVGAPTFGAGCGHMTGAKPERLNNSGGIVSMPDCLRLRADGSNEVAGVEPDVAVTLRPFDTRRQRVQRLAPAMSAAVRAALAKR